MQCATQPVECGTRWHLCPDDLVVYGGTGYKKNPIGKGRDKDESGVTWWPNVVDPNLGDREPAGFGPINRAWSQRADKLGSYGGDYMEKRWPWFPEDFDWGYFNAAPEDRRIVAFGQIESSWPVCGSVLVVGGTAYFRTFRH